MMFYAYAFEEGIKCLIFPPNLFGWHEFFYQIGVQQVFGNLGNTETPRICVSTNISKQICYDHR